MSRIMNWMMGEAEAGRFQFRETPDCPDEAEYYHCGISWSEARELLDNAPEDPEWTEEQLNDCERQQDARKQKKNFIPFELDEVPF